MIGIVNQKATDVNFKAKILLRGKDTREVVSNINGATKLGKKYCSSRNASKNSRHSALLFENIAHFHQATFFLENSSKRKFVVVGHEDLGKFDKALKALGLSRLKNPDIIVKANAVETFKKNIELPKSVDSSEILDAMKGRGGKKFNYKTLQIEDNFAIGIFKKVRNYCRDKFSKH